MNRCQYLRESPVRAATSETRMRAVIGGFSALVPVVQDHPATTRPSPCASPQRYATSPKRFCRREPSNLRASLLPCQGTSRNRTASATFELEQHERRAVFQSFFPHVSSPFPIPTGASCRPSEFRWPLRLRQEMPLGDVAALLRLLMVGRSSIGISSSTAVKISQATLCGVL